MAMTSLKRGEHAEMEAMTYSEPNYGYGAEIYLDGEQCEALGISKMVRAGQPVTIRAKGIVKRASEELEASDDSGGKDISLCIQLTDMDVTMVGTANAAKAAKMLYGDDE